MRRRAVWQLPERTVRILACTAAISLCPAAVSSASAAIVPGQGIAGVWLGDRGAKVRELLGRPLSVQKHRGGESWFWHGPVDWATLTTHHVVVGLETASKREKTSKGVGPGSSLSAVKKAYPGIKCHPSFLGHSGCALTTKHSAQIVRTYFGAFLGKVEFVDIGAIGQLT